MKQTKREPMGGRFPSRAILSIALAICALAIDPALFAQGGQSKEHWVGTWATALVGRAPDGSLLAGFPSAPPPPMGQAPAAPLPAPQPPLNLDNQTLRQIVHTSIGGERVRVVLSNAFGTAPLAIGAAHVALREKGAAIVPASGRVLTFGRRSSATIPPGAVLVSDPVNLTVPALGDMTVDVYLPGNTAAGTSPLTTHTGALQTNYVSPSGNHTATVNMPIMRTTRSWFFLARVEVTAPEETGAVVAIGDSITDGSRSTEDTNNRWPDHLARRLVSQKIKMGVLNVGISGNRLLTDGVGGNALGRFDRDVLVQSGATHVVVLEGVNDIGLASMSQLRPPSAADLIAAHRQLIERAHARGLKIYAGTLTPFEGTTIAGYWSKEGDVIRQAVNQWIRTSGAYDAVIDFEAAARNPAQPTWFLSQYDSGDHIHPGDFGYKAMADAVPVELFRIAERTAARATAVAR